MVFTRFVEPGRVILFTYGPYTGKLAIIVEIINVNRVLVDGPTSGVKRHETSLRRVKLTDVTVNVNKGAKTTEVK